MTTTYYLSEGEYETDYRDLHEFYLAGNDYFSLPALVDYLEDVQALLDDFGAEVCALKAERRCPIKFHIVDDFVRFIQQVSGVTPTPHELSDILYDLHIYLIDGNSL